MTVNLLPFGFKRTILEVWINVVIGETIMLMHQSDGRNRDIHVTGIVYFHLEIKLL